MPCEDLPGFLFVILQLLEGQPGLVQFLGDGHQMPSTDQHAFGRPPQLFQFRLHQYFVDAVGGRDDFIGDLRSGAVAKGAWLDDAFSAVVGEFPIQPDAEDATDGDVGG